MDLELRNKQVVISTNLLQRMIGECARPCGAFDPVSQIHGRKASHETMGLPFSIPNSRTTGRMDHHG